MKAKVESKEIGDVISNAGVGWAMGCSQCQYGYVSAPALTRATDLHKERLVQHIDGEVTYCGCRAGLMAQHLWGQKWALLMIEASTDAGMASYAERDSHPEVEIARDAIHTARKQASKPVVEVVEEEFPEPPTMRFEPSAPVVDDDEFPIPKPVQPREGAPS